MKGKIILYCTASLTFVFYFLVLFDRYQHHTNKQLSVKPYFNYSSFPKDIRYLILYNNYMVEKQQLYLL